MKEISLGVLHFRDPSDDIFRDRVRMEWVDVDTILAGQQFSNLKSVRVRHAQYNTGQTQYPLEWFFDRLPLCHNRGILRLGEAGKWCPFI
jgi:hypothetical protein